MITKINEFYNSKINSKINESSWDSHWDLEKGLIITLDDKSTVEVNIKFIAFYDTPSYISLSAVLTPKTLNKLGYTNYNENDGDLDIWSKSKESDKLNIREMDDEDVYDLFSKSIPNQFKLTQHKLESLILKATDKKEKAIRKTIKKK